MCIGVNLRFTVLWIVNSYQTLISRFTNVFFFDKLVKLVKIQGSFVCSKVLTFKPIFNFEFLFCYNSLIDIFFPYYIDLIQYCPREQDWIRLIDICDGKTRKFRWLWISQFELEIYFLYVIRSKNLNLQ